MYQPKKNNLIHNFFSWYISFLLKRNFQNNNVIPAEYKVDASVLLLANHFSWWDGFLLFQLNKLLFKKRFHILVNTDNYLKVGFLKFLGAFSVENRGKDVLETLSYANHLLADGNNLVVVFPQGKLFSNHLKSINFEKGVMHIINENHQKMNVIFAATFIDYFSHNKPSVYTYLHTFENETYVSLQLLKSSYNKHYEQSLIKQTQLSE